MHVADPVSSTVLAYTYSIVGQSPRSLFVAGPLPGDRDYRFTVPGPPPALSNSRYTGPYRFHVYEIDPKPETAAGAIAVNTVVTEQIDIPGDIDDFTFDAFFVYPEELKSVARIQVFRDFLVAKAQQWNF